MLQDQSHKTAITRRKPSAPLKYLEGVGYFRRDDVTRLDYGCGKGFDADYYGMDKYDPYYFPDLDRSKKYDIIFCTYVLNVVDEKTEFEILKDVSSLLKPDGRAMFTVRRDMPRSGRIFSGYRQRFSDVFENEFIKRESFHHCIHTVFAKYGQWVMWSMRKLPEVKTFDSLLVSEVNYNHIFPFREPRQPSIIRTPFSLNILPASSIVKISTV